MEADAAWIYIEINKNLQLAAILFAYDLALTAFSEDGLQHSIHNLLIVANKYNMEINIEETAVIAFCGKDPIPSKICSQNKFVERLNTFTYLGYILSYYGELDLPDIITKCTKTINKVLKPSLVQKHPNMPI
jgi:hypothetical protein